MIVFFHKFHICLCFFHMNVMDVTVCNLQLLILYKIIFLFCKGNYQLHFLKNFITVFCISINLCNDHSSKHNIKIN